MVNNQDSTGDSGIQPMTKTSGRLEVKAGVLGSIVAVAILMGLITSADPYRSQPFFDAPAKVMVLYPDIPVPTRQDAITEYLAFKYRKAPQVVRKYVDIAWQEAERHAHVSPELLLAIMQKESSLRPHIRNDYGAEGLMQVVRRWHSEKLSHHESLLDEEVNIRVGAQILQEYIDQEGHLVRALRKYSGDARNYAEGVLAEMKALERISA